MSKTLQQFDGLPMFDGPSPPPRARESDPETSHEAAASMANEAAAQRSKIHRALLCHGGKTADGLDEFCELRVTSAGRRLPELQKLGLARPTDRKEKTRSGRMARVWEAVK